MKKFFALIGALTLISGGAFAQAVGGGSPIGGANLGVQTSPNGFKFSQQAGAGNSLQGAQAGQVGPHGVQYGNKGVVGNNVYGQGGSIGGNNNPQPE